MEHTIDTVYLYQCCFGKHNNFSISICFSIHDKFILVLVLVKFNYNFSFSISFRNQKSNNISSSFSLGFSFSRRLLSKMHVSFVLCQKKFSF